MCCKRPSRREPSNFTMVHRYWSMCHLPFAISHFASLIKKYCWPSFGSSVTQLVKQDLPTPVEEKPVYVDVFAPSGFRIQNQQRTPTSRWRKVMVSALYLKHDVTCWQQLFGKLRCRKKVLDNIPR